MNKSTVHLPISAYDAIVEHAREGKPEEICGVLRGRGLDAYAVIRGQNIAADRIIHYEVDPHTLLLQFEFEEHGEEMMGIYHSHPVSVAYPSATDAWNAHYPESIYFICSLEHDDAPVLRAFRMTPHFLDLDYKKLRKQLPFFETRPGLWAFYQAANAKTPGALTDIAAQVTAPFYVVSFAGDADPEEGRVVAIVEHPIEFVDVQPATPL